MPLLSERPAQPAVHGRGEAPVQMAAPPRAAPDEETSGRGLEGGRARLGTAAAVRDDSVFCARTFEVCFSFYFNFSGESFINKMVKITFYGNKRQNT